jgi:hypothetical protein
MPENLRLSDDSGPDYGAVGAKGSSGKEKPQSDLFTTLWEMVFGLEPQPPHLYWWYATYDFWYTCRLAFSMTIGVMFAAIPSLLKYHGTNLGWFEPPSYLDGYPAVITVFICGTNLGETNQYNWDSLIGTIPTQLFLVFWHWAFGLNHNSSVFCEIALFSSVVMLLNVSSGVKKYANGLNIWVAVAVLSNENTVNFGWYLIAWGLWGYAGALVANMCPPRFAVVHLRHQLRNGEDQVSLAFAQYLQWIFGAQETLSADKDSAAEIDLDGDGQISAEEFAAAFGRAERILCQELQDEVAKTIGKCNARQASSWWEPHSPGYLHKTNMLIGLLTGLAQRLECIQQMGVFRDGDFSKRKGMQKTMSLLRVDLLTVYKESERVLRQITDQIVVEGRHSLTVDTTALHDSLKELVQALHEVSIQNIEEDIDFSYWGQSGAELFVGCICCYGQYLMQFPMEYNESTWPGIPAEIQQFAMRLSVICSPKAMFGVGTEHWGNFPQAFKVTLAIISASLLGVYEYNMDSTAPITIAYVINNAVGGAVNTTKQRCLGVIVGAVLPIVFVHLFSTHTISVAIIMASWVFFCSYVRCAEGPHAYAGMVGSFLVVEVLLDEKSTTTGKSAMSFTDQSSFQTVEQTCLGVIVFVVVELFPLWAVSSPALLREGISDVLALTADLQTEIYHYVTESDENFDGLVRDETGKRFKRVGTNEYVDASSVHVEEQAKLAKIQEMGANLSSSVAGLIGDYQASVIEPEIYKQPFRWECYKSILLHCDEMQRSLKMVAILWGSNLGWLRESWSGDETAASQHYQRIMNKIDGPMNEMQIALASVLDDASGVLEDHVCEVLNIGPQLKAKKTVLQETYAAARDGVIDDLHTSLRESQSQNENIDAKKMSPVSPVDRLRLAAWMVCINVITEDVIAIYQELSHEHWDHKIMRFTDLESGLKRYTDGPADKVGKMDDKQWRALKASTMREMNFYPSGRASA